MAHVGTAPRVKNTVLFGVGLAIAILLGWLVYQSLPTERGISTVSPFGQLVFLVFGVIFGGALVISAAFKKPEISRAAWMALKVGVTLLAVWWFVWGRGLGAIGGSDPVATPFKGVSRVEVPLGGGRPVPVDRLVRGGWCYTIRRGTAENLRLVFADSSNPEPFGQKYVGWREIQALVADKGTAAIEVWPPTRGSCNPDDAAR